jgi:hypothetical protein
LTHWARCASSNALHGFLLDQKRPLDEQINEVLADHRAGIGDRDATLLRNGESPLAIFRLKSLP